MFSRTTSAATESWSYAIKHQTPSAILLTAFYAYFHEFHGGFSSKQDCGRGSSWAGRGPFMRTCSQLASAEAPRTCCNFALRTLTEVIAAPANQSPEPACPLQSPVCHCSAPSPAHSHAQTRPRCATRRGPAKPISPASIPSALKRGRLVAMEVSSWSIRDTIFLTDSV